MVSRRASGQLDLNQSKTLKGRYQCELAAREDVSDFYSFVA